MELTKEEFQQGLEGVKRYFDEKTAEMKNYVDEKNAEQTQEMKSYVDEKNTELKNYVDEKIESVIIYVDEKHNEVKNYVDKKFSGVHAEIQVVQDNIKDIHTQIDWMKYTLNISVGVIAGIACIIAVAPIFKEFAAGLRNFFTRPKEDLNARISELEKKILALTEEKGR